MHQGVRHLIARGWRWRAGIAVLALSLALIGMLASFTPAQAAGGDFQIALGGQVSSSQVTGTDSQGRRTIDASLELAANTGQYPAVMLQMDLTELVSASGTGSFTGTGVLSDESGQHALFHTQIRGTISADSTFRFQALDPQAAQGSGGGLTLSGGWRSNKTGALAGIAQGTLQFPTGLPASLVTGIWPAVGPAYAASTADPSLWYVTRGAASTAYVLLIITTITGAGISTQAFDSVTRRWRVLDLHQVLTLLMLGLIALHLVTLVLDPFLPFSPAQLAWPVGEPYRAVPVALGVIGLYALLIVTISSWVRPHLGYRVWRALHYVSVVALVALTLHGILAGTDTATPWMIAIYVTGSLAVLALAALRVIQTLTRVRPARVQSF
jgi:sulfoxide reductase heme-binding subunit YedZ